MITKIKKWGNSDGIRIPSTYLKNLDLKTDDLVDISSEDDKIIITKYGNKHLTIEERIIEYESLFGNKKKNNEEYDWGEDVGKEKL